MLEKENHIQVDTLSYSLMGLCIPIVTITNFTNNLVSNEAKNHSLSVNSSPNNSKSIDICS
jgi:hypothetical protein